MRFLILAAAAGAIAMPAAVGAQYYGGYGSNNGYGYNNRVRQDMRQCQREASRSYSRRDYFRRLRECRRELSFQRRGSYGYGNAYGRDDRRYWDGYRWRYRY